MKKLSRRVAASVLAAAAVCACAVTASSETSDDPTPGSTKFWDVRCIGGGAPSSADKVDKFWVYNSSNGHSGKCKSIISDATEFGVTAKCIDGEHTIDTKTWNGKGEKTWSVGNPNTHVRYEVNAYGRNTFSKGTIGIIFW